MSHVSTHSAFDLVRQSDIPSLNILAQEYRHRQTGAYHLHLACDNPENVFLVGFRTIPVDSTGVAHILEHTALCGSEKYPVRDPFFMMIRRSLNTFMNAFTSSDWTAYPFASKNRKDFFNLLDVYLDATFFSRLDPLDFAQEGHRVEFENATDQNSDLVFKGVVFNEMKGAMSSPVSILWQTLTSHLFPTTTYHYNSGGEPEQIPDLTHSQLLDFYKRHYHPSNAMFMTFGDIDVTTLHEKFEARALHHFTMNPERIEVNDEMRYPTAMSVVENYALDNESDLNDKTHIVVSWLLGHSSNERELLEAQLMAHVLLENSSSPLLHALETTDLGQAPSPLCGLEDSNREMSFICGVEGSKPEHAQAVENLVLKVLEDVAANGVPYEQVAAVLHQLELSQREITGGSYPYGLQLILSALPAAVHRGDCIAMLDIDLELERLRQAILDPAYIKNLVRKHLLDNRHRVRLTLKPDATLNSNTEKRERERLALIKASMTDAEKQAVMQRTQALQERQVHQDDPTILPKVTLTDIPTHTVIAAGTIHPGKISSACYPQATNGLIYQDIVYDLPALKPELIQILPYYAQCIGELGCGKQDYIAMQAWQARVSGGVAGFASIRPAIDNIHHVAGKFSFSGKALQRNNGAFNELLATLERDMRFDELSRIQEIMSQMRAAREQAITGNGHQLAMGAASSSICQTANLHFELFGLAGIASLKQLDDSLKDTAACLQFAERMSAIHQQIIAAPKKLLLISDANYLVEQQKLAIQTWQQSASHAGFKAFELTPEPARHVNDIWITNTQVNFCAKAYATVPQEHPDTAPLAVLAAFLRNGYLHRTIREQGGAYGGGASVDSDIAAFRFYSYRDPRLQETLADFDRSLDWLARDNHTWQGIEEAILGVISHIDKPSSPAGEAKQAFYNREFGRTDEYKQRYRERVLAVQLTDLQRVADLYLQPKLAHTAVISNNATLKEHGNFGLNIRRL